MKHTSSSILEQEQIPANKLSLTRIKEAFLLLRALNNQVRQRILKLLEQYSKLSVTEIVKHMGHDQSVISVHLAILRRSKLSNTTEKENIYVMNSIIRRYRK